METQSAKLMKAHPPAADKAIDTIITAFQKPGDDCRRFLVHHFAGDSLHFSAGDQNCPAAEGSCLMLCVLFNLTIWITLTGAYLVSSRDIQTAAEKPAGRMSIRHILPPPRVWLNRLP